MIKNTGLKSSSSSSLYAFNQQKEMQKELQKELKKIELARRHFELDFSLKRRKVLSRFARTLMRSSSNLSAVMLAKAATEAQSVRAATTTNSTARKPATTIGNDFAMDEVQSQPQPQPQPQQQHYSQQITTLIKGSTSEHAHILFAWIYLSDNVYLQIVFIFMYQGAKESSEQRSVGPYIHGRMKKNERMQMSRSSKENTSSVSLSSFPPLHLSSMSPSLPPVAVTGSFSLKNDEFPAESSDMQQQQQQQQSSEPTMMSVERKPHSLRQLVQFATSFKESQRRFFDILEQKNGVLYTHVNAKGQPVCSGYDNFIFKMNTKKETEEEVLRKKGST